MVSYNRLVRQVFIGGQGLDGDPDPISGHELPAEEGARARDRRRGTSDTSPLDSAKSRIYS
jgi:hypothetical protein